MAHWLIFVNSVFVLTHIIHVNFIVEVLLVRIIGANTFGPNVPIHCSRNAKEIGQGEQ
jgi:hypothetical protein